jgi:hypothetical protein
MPLAMVAYQRLLETESAVDLVRNEQNALRIERERAKVEGLVVQDAQCQTVLLPIRARGDSVARMVGLPAVLMFRSMEPQETSHSGVPTGRSIGRSM